MAASDAPYIFLALMAPFLAAAAAPVLTRALGHWAALPLALVPAGIFAFFCRALPDVQGGQALTGGYVWVPSFNVSYSWLIDGLSLTFVLLISGIGALILLYAGGYLKGHPQQGRFFAFILMFMGSMLGVVVSDSFLMLFVYWELTSITSFLLIGFDHAREASRRAAIQALVVTGGGGLALLAGLILIWNVTGISTISLLTEYAPALKASPYYFAALLLILGGAFTKSAQFPFHFWLPNAMEAPTPVSAYLHSATMVKAGVFLLMRLQPALGDTPAWETILPVFGGATLIAGTIIGIGQTDLKQMLAYTTVASLGLLVMMTGFGTPHALESAALYLVAHAFFKGALFMVAGAIDHEAGTRDVTRLSGLRRVMPVTFAAAIVAALSMGGLPPFLGFLAKEEVYEALAGGNPRAIAFTLAAIVGNGLMFALAFAVALKPFAGAERDLPGPHHEAEAGTEIGAPPSALPGISPSRGENGKRHAPHIHEAPALMLAGPVVLALAGLLAGVFSQAFHATFASPMASAIAHEARAISISAIPHLSLPFLLSLATIALGVIVYLFLDRAREAATAALESIGWGPDQGFDQAMRGLVRGAYLITRRIQTGRLETYIMVTFIVIGASLLLPMAVFSEWPALPGWPVGVAFHELVIFAIAVIGLFAVVGAADRLTAIVSLGIQGFAVALIFMLYGAPDLAFTQFMVETLSVVILALVMTRLDLKPSDHRHGRELVKDAIIALACGVGFTALLLRAVQGPFNTALTDFFSQWSKVVAHGTNVVNVIIVDFRGTDTLGEIAVVTITGLAILALIRIRAGGDVKPADNDPERSA
ncbi:multicomponent Na+:H+ antiporter subunit A [Rhizobium aquaticum]|uniref:Multicomponent Na+:H+ antiporter subunit A n=1 Tax=Rhizobium aquaticum TaxID=1549636 RepID=A0ABV2IXT7_9HYPH